MKTSSKLSIAVEVVAWAAGGALLTAYVTAAWHFSRSRESGLQEFAAAKAMAVRASELPIELGAVEVQLEPLTPLAAAKPDMTFWSAGRIAAYEAQNDPIAPQAVLRISSIDLEVPVYVGVTESNLNRGAAWIETTAALDAVGNIGLASHRDGYFRSLRTIEIGDRIELQTLQDTRVYAVDDISVVEPDEVEVLAPSSDQQLTLVTCYPFYMVGPAPKRFIVRARAASARDPS